LDDACSKHQIRILLVDGPQGWKAADSKLVHSRRCERTLNTPAKTGLPGSVKPSAYSEFVKFSIRLFDELAVHGWERLPNVGDALVPDRRYVIESFPLSAWRTLGISPLPAKTKSRTQDLETRFAALSSLLPLHVSGPLNHDTLQAMVAGLAGIAVERNDWSATAASGTPPSFQDGHWREGFILSATQQVGRSICQTVPVERRRSQAGFDEAAKPIGRPAMSSEQRLHFRDALRESRAVALADAEGFDPLLFAIERLGRYVYGENANLGAYQGGLEQLAAASPLAETIPLVHPDWHARFGSLLRQLRQARNSALHEGAFARHLTSHAVAVALTLEDALMNGSNQIRDFMVRTPVCALKWQPISFIRQTMLTTSFSYLPLNTGSEEAPDWKLVSDVSVAKYLRNAGEPKKALAMTVEDALSTGGLELSTPFVCASSTSVRDALDHCKGLPVLVIAAQEPASLLGMATPFDLL